MIGPADGPARSSSFVHSDGGRTPVDFRTAFQCGSLGVVAGIARELLAEGTPADEA